MPYTVPSLTRAEVDSARRATPRPADCPQCQSGFPVDHWPSTVACTSSYRREDGRLFRVHCTCDYCF